MTTGQPRPCETPCSGGNPCVCDDKPKHPHTIHVCSKEGCRCHDVACHMEKVMTRNGEGLYIPQGARLAPRKPVAA